MRFSLFAVSAGLLSLLLPVAARADITGDVFDVSYRYPTQDQIFNDFGPYTVPSTGEIPGNPATFILTPTQFSLVFTGGDQVFPSAFSGLEFTDITEDPMITNATLDGLSTLFDAVVTYTSNSVALNLGNLGVVSAGDTAIVDLTFAAPPVAATPEPSSLALLGTGVLGVSGVVRRRLARA